MLAVACTYCWEHDDIDKTKYRKKSGKIKTKSFLNKSSPDHEKLIKAVGKITARGVYSAGPQSSQLW